MTPAGAEAGGREATLVHLLMAWNDVHAARRRLRPLRRLRPPQRRHPVARRLLDRTRPLGRDPPATPARVRPALPRLRRRAAVADGPAPRPPREDAGVPRLRCPARLAHRPDAPRGRGLSAGRGSGHADRPGDAPRRGRPPGVPAGTEGDLRLELTTPPAPVPALPCPDADDPGRTVRHAPGPPHDRHDPHRLAFGAGWPRQARQPTRPILLPGRWQSLPAGWT